VRSVVLTTLGIHVETSRWNGVARVVGYPPADIELRSGI
jgi:hypothetical protein